MPDPQEDQMLTTSDNPFNPFTEFDAWNAYDMEKGYYTCAYLARITRTSDELSDEDQELAIDQAMAEIMQFNLTGNYVLVTKENFEQKVTARQKK